MVCLELLDAAGVRVRLESQVNRADDAISTERYFITTHTRTGERPKGPPPLSNFSANFIYPWGIGAEVFYNVVIIRGTGHSSLMRS